ncbi:hypothetical protein C1X05_13965 [Laceyella sacchari]|uniref:Uncharacterized protein n=3 Tax=Laceyella TaxID=292635 RepID=A0AA45WQ14_9BACL|nr:MULTISPECIES: hypothetical protein [Laceyella]AUS09816.1 hypothetical protein C1X05_13965 [Laceyella sacchari]KPC72584.1 hypothetical protein ADL26_14755 [Thermoactinomyces vulgaris]MRG28311.1 hypothetical protein [Laceyella tengchongensis]PRZ14760.1 hypothetical protein CLV36_10574 [Laceyella sediminis]TCW38832.1 hypothetical protein EDC32_10270 [Laceyella sacchari]
MMFHALLAARDELLSKRHNNQENEYEMFAKSVQKLKKDMEVLGIKPSKEKLYGRPFRGE